MFKALTPYRIAAHGTLRPTIPEFVPCGATQPASIGFVPPRGPYHPLSERGVMMVCIERKTIPGEVLKREVDRRCKKLEDETGRKAGKKARADLKEEAYLELLPKAFPKRRNVPVLFLDDMVLVGSTAAADIDMITSLLVEAFDGLSLGMLQTDIAPAARMTQWLRDADSRPHWLAIGSRATLERLNGEKMTLADAEVDRASIVSHIADEGACATALALGVEGQASFVLTDDLQLKSIKLADVLYEGRHDEDAFDADAVLCAAALGTVLRGLVQACGGLQHAA